MSRNTQQYRSLARNESRFRLKERIKEELLDSIKQKEHFHTRFNLERFHCILLPSDIQEIRQCVNDFKRTSGS